MKRYLFSAFLLLISLCCHAQCWKEVSAGNKYTLAIKSDGTLWSWGNNSSGQGGTGGYVSSTIPVQVGTATNWQSISASDSDHAKAIQSNGTLWGWSSNGFGEQGDGTTFPVLVPTQIGTDTDWLMVDGTWRSTIALKTNGTLWAWGYNTDGELGNGTQTDSHVPIQVGTDADWKAISAGNRHLLAIKANGTLWAWGDNSVFQLGDGTTNISLVPKQIGTDTDWQSVNAGWLQSSARKLNGTLWMWGSNPNGGLGDGTLGNHSTPTLVTTGNNFQVISLGANFTMGVRAGGTLWGWGAGSYGQLGYGNNMDQLLPIQSGTVAIWRMVDAGSDHAAGIRTDGTLWTWGRNMNGQMGTGNYYTAPGGSNFPMEVFSPNVITANATGTTVCAGASVVLTATGTATSYTWSGGVVDGVSFVPAATTVYSVTGYDAIGCYNTSTVAVIVNPSTTVTANATSTTVCLGDAVTLTGSGAGSYTWTGGVTDGVAFTPTATTTYSVTDASGCSNTASITIRVLPTPTITGVSSKTTCVPYSSVVITPSGATTYTLMPGNVTGISFTVSPWLPVSTYTVIGTNGVGCISNSLTSLQTTVYVGPSNPVYINSSSANGHICEGDTYTLTATGGGPGTYTWSTGVYTNSVYVWSTETGTNSVVGTATTSIWYTVSTSSLASCGYTADVVIVPNARPTIVLNDTTICSGSSTTLSPTSNSPITTFTWSTGSTANSITVSPSATTSYTINADLVGCKSNSVVTVYVSPSGMPVTGFSYASPLCSTGNNQLPNTAAGFSPNGSFSSSTGLVINAVSGSIDPALSTPGSYVVTYSVGANTCAPAGTGTAAIVINSPAPAVTTFSYTSPLCPYGTVLPDLASGFSGGGSYTGTAGLAINSSTGLIDLSVSTPGTYTVSYNFQASNCIQAGSGAYAITIPSAPSISVNSDVTIITGGSTTLNANSSTNTYTWFPSTNLSCTVCQNPTASPGETTNYCVTTSDGVCTNSACVTVNVQGLCDGDKGLFLPNAFSPNEDGNNDLFCIQGGTKCVTNFSIIIYDRWGEKMFSSSDVHFCWDGIYAGKKLPPDVFVYYMKAIDHNHNEIIKKGNVTLIK